MKILQITTQGEQGGAQIYTRDSSIRLAAKGHDVYVATGMQSRPGDSWLFNQLLANNFDRQQLKIIPSLRREVSFFDDIKSFIQTFKLVDKIRPDIVHLHSSKAGTVCAVAAKLAGATVVYTVHGFVFNEPMGKLKKYFYIISELVARFFRNYTITVSKFDLQTGKKMHIIPKKKGEAIYNGIDEAKEKSILTKKEAKKKIFEKMGISFNEDVRIVGLVANLYPAKGITYLVNAAYLAKKYKGLQDTIFVIIGDGMLRDELQKEINELGIDTIFFLIGSMPEAYKYVKGFDVFVMSSVKEGFPYTLLEVIMARVPFLATRVGGIPEIENYAAAPLIEPGSAKFLTEAVMEFLSRSVTRKKKEVGNTFPEKFTVKYMVDRVEEVYKKLLG